MENSSPSTTSPASPIVFPANAFGPGWTVATLLGMCCVFLGVVLACSVAWIAVHGADVATLQRNMLGLPGIELQSAGEIAVVIFLAVALPALAKTSAASLGFRVPQAADWPKIALAIAAMFVLVTALASLLTTVLHFKTPELAVQAFTQTHGWQKVLFFFFAVVVGPVSEEFVFRFLIFNAMRKWWGFWPGAIVSSLLFGVTHAQPPLGPAMFVALCLPLAVGGFVLCTVYARTGNAWSNMITHAAFNGLSLALITVAPQLAK